MALLSNDLDQMQTAAEFFQEGLEGVEDLDDNDLGFQVRILHPNQQLFKGLERFKHVARPEYISALPLGVLFVSFCVRDPLTCVQGSTATRWFWVHRISAP